MESQALPFPPERKGLFREVLLGSILYTLSTLKVWLLWSLPLVLCLAVVFHVSESGFGLVKHFGQDAGLGPDPKVMLPHTTEGLLTVLVMAPVGLMAQRHILLGGKEPEWSFLSTLGRGRLWHYAGMALARGLLFMAVTTVGVPLVSIGVAGLTTGVEVVRALGLLLMVASATVMLGLMAHVWFRLELAFPLCAIGARDPLRRSWEIMGGKVLKILLPFLALLLLDLLVSHLYGTLAGTLPADDLSPFLALADGVLAVLMAVAYAALSGKFLAYVRIEAAVGDEDPAALVPGHEPSASG